MKNRRIWTHSKQFESISRKNVSECEVQSMAPQSTSKDKPIYEDENKLGIDTIPEMDRNRQSNSSENEPEEWVPLCDQNSDDECEGEALGYKTANTSNT